VQRPELQVEILGTTTTSLLNSSASISAVSEQFFSTLRNQVSLPEKLSTLPVTGVTISTAVQGRSKKITRQAYISLTVFGNDAPGIFLIIPHLTTEMILGDDWRTQYGIILNYVTHQVEIPKWSSFSPFRLWTGVEDSFGSTTKIIVHQ